METAGKVVVAQVRYSWIIVDVNGATRWRVPTIARHTRATTAKGLTMFTHVYSLIKQFATVWHVTPWTATFALQLIDTYFTNETMNVIERLETVERHAYNAVVTVGDDDMTKLLASDYDVIMLKSDGVYGRYYLMNASDGSMPKRLHLLADGVVFVVVETEY